MALTRREHLKIWRFCLITLTVVGLFSGCSQSAPEPTNLLFNDPAELLATKAKTRTGDPDLRPLLDTLKTEAMAILDADVSYSVMKKPFTPASGDKHDYMSMGPYWWPDKSKPDGLPYIRRDGQVNPERDLYDAIPMRTMDREVTTLAVAYFYLGDESYAEHACRLIRTWFLPHGIRPGHPGQGPRARYGNHRRPHLFPYLGSPGPTGTFTVLDR
jgi:hypothetical protein